MSRTLNSTFVNRTKQPAGPPLTQKPDTDPASHVIALFLQIIQNQVHHHERRDAPQENVKISEFQDFPGKPFCSLHSSAAEQNRSLKGSWSVMLV